jgi:hypothetical protein
VSLDQELHIGGPAILRVRLRPAWRTKHSELPAQPVLGGRGAVRVQQVPLEQDRVGDCARLGKGDRGERHRWTSMIASSCMDMNVGRIGNTCNPVATHLMPNAQAP